jgi:Ca2+-binding RTX toxin-like protein
MRRFPPRWMTATAVALAAGLVATTASTSLADPPVYVRSIEVEWGWANAVAPDGSVLLTGFTGGAFQPTPGAWDTTADNPSDAFALKMDATGRVEWATYIGGASTEDGGAIAAGPDGGVYVAGRVQSTEDQSGDPVVWFPTTEGALSQDYARDQFQEVGWLLKLSPDGSAVEWSTLLPGVRHVLDLEVDAEGRAHFVGEAYEDLPVTSEAFDTISDDPDPFPDADGVVATVSADGSSYEHASFIGGSEWEELVELDLGPGGSTYVAGTTRSNDFPVTDSSYQTVTGGGYDGFVAKVAEDGTLEWSTYLGAGAQERVSGLAVDQQGRAVLSGRDPGSDFPVTPQAQWQTPPPGLHSWAAKVTGDGDELEWATYVPGGLQEAHLDRQGHTHMVALGADPDTLVEGSPFVVMVELDRQGELRSSRAAADQSVLDFDTDSAGSSYLVSEPKATTARTSATTTPQMMLSRLPICTVSGTPGDDVLVGTPGPDVICAGDGDDMVDSGDGYDVLLLGRGDDEGVSGAGVDVVRGGRGADQVRGGRDRDLLIGNSGSDEIVGGQGPDTLIGGDGRDILRGGSGNDELRD